VTGRRVGEGWDPTRNAPSLFDDEPAEQMHRSAVISDDGIYRYSLARWWNTDLPRDLWLMCNPSDGDHLIDDNTIGRCRGFSRRNGSGGFNIANAYGFRSPKPAVMWAAQAAGVDIIGPDNDDWIRHHCSTAEGRVIVAWGAHPKPERAYEVAEIVRSEGREPLCLGTTKGGQPRHPLMLPNIAQLQPWTGLAVAS
jgi:hypothetical protein